MFEETERKLGPLDIVVASAADILVKPMIDCTEEDYDRIFQINAKGVFFTMQEAARRLRDDGRIIVLSTGGTKLFFADQSLYLGSKGAVEQFVRCLAWELGDRRITVNALSPGPTETDMMQDRYRERAASLSPLKRLGNPDEIAKIAVFLASDGGRWVTALAAEHSELIEDVTAGPGRCEPGPASPYARFEGRDGPKIMSKPLAPGRIAQLPSELALCFLVRRAANASHQMHEGFTDHESRNPLRNMAWRFGA
jgi:hypothetical protein